MQVTMASEDKQRARAIERFKALLPRRGNPYGHMTLILLATGCAGFLSSRLLHTAGLTSMGVRYPIAVGLAYLVFLCLVGVWVSYQRRASHKPRGDTAYIDTGPYYCGDPFPTSGAARSPGHVAATGQKKGSGGGDWGGADGEGAAVLVVILVVIAVLAALTASIYVVIEAPVLFAEVLVDAGLMAGMSHKLRRSQDHWTAGVIRRTWLPAAALALCFSLVGFGLEHLVPKATTLAEAWTRSQRNS
jgi:hypothetical protein